MTNTKPTVEEMRQMVADADRAASEAGLEQLNGLLVSDEWTKVKTEINALSVAYAHDPLSKMQLNSMVSLMSAIDSLPAQVRQRIAAASAQ